ncbi:CBS domain-containing protein [Bacillus sp. V3B]|uniref:CBS domain-containing protein n=1 Tax=Bacillus sp. V3B TaxID=2804915 RepID=UPI00210E3A03|nr:CBS domain-containing protein [Bacillus sp. V3B]MCQ6273948.1 CBS domain-containing protein [Bacillus sp. V3B]
MRAHEIMKKQVIKVKEHDSVQSVIRKFMEYDISGLPIVNDRNKIVAYISDGDIMRFIGKPNDIVIGTLFFAQAFKVDEDEFEERAQKVRELNVMEIAQKTVYKVKWDEKIENIAAILGKKQIKRLPVERNGVLVGIISRGDVIRNTFKSLNTCLKQPALKTQSC